MRNLLAICLNPLVSLVPRKKKKWVYGAMRSFRDNPKFLFCWANENHPEIRSIWITHQKGDVIFLRERGFEAYYVKSLKGLFHALTAKVYIFDHQVGNVNSYLSGGAFLFNLWHGSSVKRVRWQSLNFFVQKYNLTSEKEVRSSLWVRIMEYPILFRKSDLCLAPSTIQAKEFFSPMMDIPLDHCLVGVYPRNQFLIEGKKSAMEFIEKYEPEETLSYVNYIRKFSKRYIYMPTWRNDGVDFIKQAEIDWEKLNQVLSEKNELFVLKLHPLTMMDVDDLSKYSHVVVYPADSDIYSVLPFMDCLISDYSSIYTDFLMMDKEIILFIFDYDNYVKNSCDLENYDYYFVGKRAENFTQLLSLIKTGEDCHVPKDHYKRLMDFFWDNNRYNIDLVEEIKHKINII